jgi:serine/threonine protein kinase
MATVYRARDEVLGRAVAVKLFDVDVVDAGRQESELAVLAGLDHHGLVNLLDAGVDYDAGGRAHRYLVMALVTGIDLQHRLRGARIAPRNIAEIGYDMAEALEYIHGHNVIHRDIKPSNILLVDYGTNAPRARAKLTDFGIAVNEDVERMTADGATTGTAAYLSPEQAAGATVGKPSDVYSLGLVLLQCFTRSIEYPGSVVESAVARLSRDPIMPSYLPEHWRDLLSSMTAREPSARPPARDLVSAFRQLAIAESGRHKDAEGDVFPGNDERSGILDTIPDEALHRATAMAARLFDAPISVVSIVDHDRTWLVSHYGEEVEQIARKVDLSNPEAPRDELIVVEDGRTDPRTADSPLVTGPVALRFYVGVPLKRTDGRTIGTLSVADFVPGTASESQLASLQDLSALIIAQLELRQAGLRIGGHTGDSVPTTAAPSVDAPTVESDETWAAPA